MFVLLVKDLSTPTFLAAFQRFDSRCRVPAYIYSDHGTNFVGAEQELTELHQRLKYEQVQVEIQDDCSDVAVE